MEEYEYTVLVTITYNVTASSKQEAEDIAWNEIEERLPPFTYVETAEVISSDEDDEEYEDEDSDEDEDDE